MENNGKITVIINTNNSEDTLCEALESSKDFDEVIIVDEHSKDDTVDIAKEYKAKIIYADKNELSPALNQAIFEASGEWILILEDDEIISQGLINEIENYILKPKKNKFAITIPQRYFYLNKEIKCARKKGLLRVFKKGYCEFNNNYHFNLALREGKIHKINKNFKNKNASLYKFKKIPCDRVFEKIIQKNKFRLKDDFSKPSVILKPIFCFIYWYFIKGAIFSGIIGFIYAKNKYFEEYLYQTMLYEKEKKSDIR